MPAKCRSCRFYRRVGVGNWETSDYKTNQGRCTHPMSERCKYAHNLIERKSYYKPDPVRNGYKSKKTSHVPKEFCFHVETTRR